MSIGIVSTFSDEGFEHYGRYFLDSLNKHLDQSIKVFLYYDNVKFKINKSTTTKQILEDSVPELTEFKKRNHSDKSVNFMFDAVRFSHKSYCLYNAALTKDVDTLIWLDSDTELSKKITPKYLKNFIPASGEFTSYLGRSTYSYTETGFLGFNLQHPHSKEFFERCKSYYDTDEIYNLAAYTDCHVFDTVRRQMENEGKIQNKNLSPDITKNHFDKTFEGFLTHFKGNKKDKREKYIQKALKKEQKKLQRAADA
jgi:hypothetical protein